MNAKVTTLDVDQMSMLQRHIQHASDELANRWSEKGSDEYGSLIFMGNVHDSFPRALITDPILNSEEIHTWMLMRLEVSADLSITRIPNQETLGAQLKSSRPIVSRNLQVLRALRWITLCQNVRGPDGKYKGAIYAQHDQPLSLAETLELDDSYLEFLQEDAKGDVLRRLNNMKHSVLKHADFAMLTDDQVLISPSRIESYKKRLEYVMSGDPLKTTLACPPEAVEPNNTMNLYSNPTVEPTVQAILEKNQNELHHVKDFYMDKPEKEVIVYNESGKNPLETTSKSHVNKVDMDNHVNNFYTAYSSGCSSSGFINKTTTTETGKPTKLELPTCLKISNRAEAFALVLVDKLPEDFQQYALHFVEDRHMAGAQGISKPIANPIGFLKAIVYAMLDGTFEPSSYGHRKAKPALNEISNEDRIKIRSEINHLTTMIDFHNKQSGDPALISELKEQKKFKEALIEQIKTGKKADIKL
ncbi:MAG: hypothetical protein ACI9FD_003488 [Gammaproteobacteria bacterium]|jgi:hypothetical protein